MSNNEEREERMRQDAAAAKAKGREMTTAMIRMYEAQARIEGLKKGPAKSRTNESLDFWTRYVEASKKKGQAAFEAISELDADLRDLAFEAALDTKEEYMHELAIKLTWSYPCSMPPFVDPKAVAAAMGPWGDVARKMADAYVEGEFELEDPTLEKLATDWQASDGDEFERLSMMVERLARYDRMRVEGRKAFLDGEDEDEDEEEKYEGPDEGSRADDWYDEHRIEELGMD